MVEPAKNKGTRHQECERPGPVSLCAGTWCPAVCLTRPGLRWSSVVLAESGALAVNVIRTHRKWTGPVPGADKRGLWEVFFNMKAEAHS